jgi:hypothetical protein
MRMIIGAPGEEPMPLSFALVKEERGILPRSSNPVVHAARIKSDDNKIINLMLCNALATQSPRIKCEAAPD